MPNQPSSVSIFLVHGNDELRRELEDAVVDLGHRLLGTGSTCAELEAACLSEVPELIITGLMFPDGDGIESLARLAENYDVPSIVVTPSTDLDRVERAMDDHVMAYLVEPVTAKDLKPSIIVVRRRFTEFMQLRAEVKDLKETLATRKLLERAKGLLMSQSGVTEEDAYISIRNWATDNRVPLVESARRVIDMFDSEAAE